MCCHRRSIEQRRSLVFCYVFICGDPIYLLVQHPRRITQSFSVYMEARSALLAPSLIHNHKHKSFERVRHTCCWLTRRSFSNNKTKSAHTHHMIESKYTYPSWQPKSTAQKNTENQQDLYCYVICARTRFICRLCVQRTASNNPNSKRRQMCDKVKDRNQIIHRVSHKAIFIYVYMLYLSGNRVNRVCGTLISTQNSNWPIIYYMSPKICINTPKYLQNQNKNKN